MLRENIDQMIMAARKERNNDKVLVYQLVKAEFLKFKTAKNAKPLDDEAEINIIKKMIKSRNDSVDMYRQGNREDLAEKELQEIAILETLVPEGPKEEDYNRLIDEYIAGLDGKTFDKSHKGLAIKYIKSNLKGADGKLASELVDKRINA